MNLFTMFISYVSILFFFISSRSRWKISTCWRWKISTGEGRHRGKLIHLFFHSLLWQIMYPFSSLLWLFHVQCVHLIQFTGHATININNSQHRTRDESKDCRKSSQVCPRLPMLHGILNWIEILINGVPWENAERIISGIALSPLMFIVIKKTKLVWPTKKKVYYSIQLLI